MPMDMIMPICFALGRAAAKAGSAPNTDGIEKPEGGSATTWRGISVGSVTREEQRKHDREFSAMVRGVDPGTESFRKYVLAELRSARKRALLLVNEIEVIGIALKNKFIDGETAMVWLAEANALEFLIPEPPMEDCCDPKGEERSSRL